LLNCNDHRVVGRNKHHAVHCVPSGNGVHSPK
jgi:hypothetical protein